MAPPRTSTRYAPRPDDLAFGLALPVASIVVLLRTLEERGAVGSEDGRIAAIGVAFGSAELFGVSFALGAFLAGMVANDSDHGERAAAELRFLQDALAVLFLAPVGMLFDPATLLERPSRVPATVAIVVVGKPLAAFLIVRAFRHLLHMAAHISVALARIGEFAFILAPRPGPRAALAGRPGPDPDRRHRLRHARVPHPGRSRRRRA